MHAPASPSARGTAEPPDELDDSAAQEDADLPRGLEDLCGTDTGLAQDDAPASVARGAAFAPADEAQLVHWIAGILQHDERALAALYDATFSRTYGLVLRIVKSAAWAEEIVEDAYFQVWRQAPRFDPARGKVLTWLLAMARSRAIDALRREARFRHDSLDDEAAAEPIDGQAPMDELLDLARRHADLHQALMALQTQPRQLVALAFFRGLSHEEIASQTELPLGTVKSQIRRALTTLRQRLGDPGLGAPVCG